MAAGPEPMGVRAYRIAYDGRPFRGFQRQPDVRTVEGELFRALSDLDVLGEAADRPPGYAAAGRTDAGVSALAQTVAFEAPDWLDPAALNDRLPGAIRAWAATADDTDLHPRRDAASRTYTYHDVRRGVDPNRARAALERLEGVHDFAAFTPDGGSTERRVLETAVRTDGPVLATTVAADGFLRYMVRRIATLVGRVATGEVPLERVDRALDGELDGPAGIATAPASPLVLVDVAYPEVAFEPDRRALAEALDRFRALHDERRGAAAAAGRVRDGLEAARDGT